MRHKDNDNGKFSANPIIINTFSVYQIGELTPFEPS